MYSDSQKVSRRLETTPRTSNLLPCLSQILPLSLAPAASLVLSVVAVDLFVDPPTAIFAVLVFASATRALFCGWSTFICLSCSPCSIFTCFSSSSRSFSTYTCCVSACIYVKSLCLQYLRIGLELLLELLYLSGCTPVGVYHETHVTGGNT